MQAVPMDNQVVVITGGTKGVGRAVAIEAAKRGADIAIGGRSEKDGQATVEAIRALTGRDALFVPGNLQDVNQCRNLVEMAVQRFGKITGFLCYAGILPAASIINTEEELFDSVFDLNIKAAFFCCKYIIPAMIQAGGGSIVTIGSIHGYGGEEDRAAYACSKGALLTLTKHIAKNYAKHRIRANWVTMGWVATEGEMALRKEQGRDLAWLEDIASRSIPLGRLLTVEDHLEGILYLLSDASSMVTGSELHITGGY